MTGNKPVRVVITDRDQAILRLLVLVRFLEAEQVRQLARFGSLRVVNARLLKLYRAGLLKRWFVANRGGAPKAIYGLSVAGASVIGAGRDSVLSWPNGELIVASQFLAHQQAVNAVFLVVCRSLASGALPNWKMFRSPISAAIPLKPDAYFEFHGQGETIAPIFLEVDRGTEPLKVWGRKAELYLKLAASGEFEHQFGKSRFRVLVVTITGGRLQTLREAIAQRTDKLFWFSTLDAIEETGFLASRWLRPKGATEVTLGL